MKVAPVGICVVVGAMRSGTSGVLLAVPAPVRTCAVPTSETFSNGSTNVMAAAAAAVFEICRKVSHSLKSADFTDRSAL